MRSVTVEADRIHVVATVTAPPVVNLRNRWLAADINGPAQGLNVLQVQYTVKWKPRLELPGQLTIGPTPLGQNYSFEFPAVNIGPDPIEINDIYNIDWQTEGGIDPEFVITTPTPVVVPAGESVEILGYFSPASAGTHVTTLMLDTNDPGFGPGYAIPLTGIGVA